MALAIVGFRSWREFQNNATTGKKNIFVLVCALLVNRPAHDAALGVADHHETEEDERAAGLSDDLKLYHFQTGGVEPIRAHTVPPAGYKTAAPSETRADLQKLGGRRGVLVIHATTDTRLMSVVHWLLDYLCNVVFNLAAVAEQCENSVYLLIQSLNLGLWDFCFGFVNCDGIPPRSPRL